MIRQRIKEVGRFAPMKLAPGEAASRNLFRCYRKKPVSAKVGFFLTFEEFREITSRHCHYCGTAPAQHHRGKKTFNGSYCYNGIDRLDSSKGYAVGNVVPACGVCNKMKAAMSPDLFIAHIKRIAEHNSR